MTYLLIFILGLVIGSFLNAMIYRLEKGESIVKNRSYCPQCEHVLAWYELIPVLSFVIQGRKCRACKGTISWQYPAVELMTAAMFTALASAFDGGQFVYLAVVASLLIAVFVYDLKHYIIPDKIIYPAIGIVILYRLFEIFNFGNWNLLGAWSLELGAFRGVYIPLLAGLAASAVFFAVFFVSKGKWLGFGDVKLVFFMGLFLGWPNILVALFFAFILGGLIGMGLVGLGKRGLQSQVPFGPFLAAGTFAALFWGAEIWQWYYAFIV